MRPWEATEKRPWAARESRRSSTSHYACSTAARTHLERYKPSTDVVKSASTVGQLEGVHPTVRRIFRVRNAKERYSAWVSAYDVDVDINLCASRRSLT